MPLRVFGVRLWRVVCLQFVCLPALGQSVPWFAILHVVTACWLAGCAGCCLRHVYNASSSRLPAHMCICHAARVWGLVFQLGTPIRLVRQKVSSCNRSHFSQSTSVIQQRSVTSQKEVQNYVQPIRII